MNAIAKTEASTGVSFDVLEKVIGQGDLSKLTPQQRVEYYHATCRSIGINPLTRPFRFMQFQGQTVMYATRDCADQLREKRDISIEITDKVFADGVFSVTARATMPTGRRDEDIGAVPFAQNVQGEARANAIMKAITKSKRRVTLSICGLGYLDETEAESLMSVGGKALPDDVLDNTPEAAPPTNGKAAKWFDSLTRAVVKAANEDALHTLKERLDVKDALENPAAPEDMKIAINTLFRDAFAKFNKVDDMAPGDADPDGHYT